MNVVVYLGNRRNREVIRQYEWNFTDDRAQPIQKHLCKFHIMLTTYENLLGEEWKLFEKMNWRVLAVDEAQRIKNDKSKLFTNLKSLRHEHRLLLTGTPIQNNTTELWTLLNFIEPTFAPLEFRLRIAPRME